MSVNPEIGRSSMEDSPQSGEDEVVEPEQGNGAYRLQKKEYSEPRD
jgi:hypothetical protein